MHIDLLFETIKELQEELERVNQAIRQIEALADGRSRLGRPPKAIAAARHQADGEPARVKRKPRRRVKTKSRDNEP